MNLIPAKTPSLIKRIFHNYIWDIPTKEKVLYLTFDDGPTPIITEWTLDILNLYNAKATFFCIGSNIESHPDTFRRIEVEGHRIGNHTFNHPRGWKTKTETYISEVQQTQESIDSRIQDSKFKVQGSEFKNSQQTELQKSKIINRQSLTPNLFRPPYGQITSSQGETLRNLGYKIIMWDVLAFDWMDAIPVERCLKNVISKATAGSIIVFHDSVKASVNMQYALPKVLDYFSEKGFEFRRIP